MKKIHLFDTSKVPPIEDFQENKDRIPGKNLFLAPQPKMTTPNNTQITTGSVGAYVEATNSVALENMRTRINELENALVQLGLIRSR